MSSDRRLRRLDRALRLATPVLLILLSAAAGCSDAGKRGGPKSDSGVDASATNPCAGVTCGGHGTCELPIAPGSSTTCECDVGWSGADCTVPVTCSGAAAPTHGSVSSASATYPNAVTYACDAGYVLTGNGGLATRDCQADASFSGTAPTCAPVDCGALPAPTNGSVTTPASTYDSTATYSCDSGYLLTGTGTRTCGAAGTWGGAAPTCEPVSMPCMPSPCLHGGTCTATGGSSYVCACPSGYSGANCGTPAMCSGAIAPANGTVSAAAATYTQTITYACDPGYTLVGSATRSCLADGSFGGTAPTCTAVMCAGLVAPANGSLSATSASFPSSVTYTCDAGYTLVGNGARACQADATFSGSDPSCAPVSCPALTAPANGLVNAPVTTFGATATYACNGGYMLSGAGTRTCQASATWSGTAPTCAPVSGCAATPCAHGTCTDTGPGTYACACSAGWSGANCDIPITCGGATAPANGSVSASTAPYNATITYACSPGYTLTGTATRTCQANGTFSGAAPTCTIVTCAGATAPSNGTVSASSATFGNGITYTCTAGYTLTGTAMRTCQADGTFSGAAPTCGAITCSGAVAPANGTVSASSATFGSSITYGCNGGYTPVGATTATCQAGGTFSNPAPTCAPVSCPALVAPTNGTVTAPSTTYGSTGSYACNGGYMLSGSSTTTCQANMTWSNPAPTCALVAMPCTPNPCMNGGTCTPNGAAYTCACAAGYSGTNCGTPVTCSGASAPANGAVSATSTTYNMSVTYSCTTGYTLTGTATRTCQANGTFSGTAPTCTIVTCAGATAPTNGSVSAMSATYDNTITYACNAGYTMTGAATRTCQAAGTFSGTQPTCAPVDCGALTAPANGAVTTPGGTAYNATATYTCNAGFARTGAATRTCQAAGTWSGSAPTCSAAAFPAGTICNASGTVRTRPATIPHVIVFMFENQNYASVMGSANAPYMNSIKNQCGYSTNYLDNTFSTDINSLSHYMAVTSGSNCNTGLGNSGTGCITDDNNPSSHMLSTVSIMEQASSYKAYQEGMSTTCRGTSTGQYAPKHNPPPYYTRIASSCPTYDVPIADLTCPTTKNSTCGVPNNAFTQDLANDTLPAYAFVTPNLLNDMHDGTVSQGDNWLHSYLPLVLASPAYLRGEVAVYVLWDEQGSFSGGPIPNFFVSPYIAPTVATATINHFSVLRGNENQLGITTYVGCASGTPPGGTGTCPAGSTADVRSIFNF